MPDDIADRDLRALAESEPAPTQAGEAELAAAALLARFPLSVARLADTLIEQWLRLAAAALRDYPAEVVRDAIDGERSLSRSLKWLPSEAELRTGLDAIKFEMIGDRNRARLALAVRHAPDHLRRCELFQWRVRNGLGDSAYATLQVALKYSEAAR